MYFNKSLQSVVAGMMLLLFAFSVTPKQLLHDTITGHKHQYAKQEGGVDFQSSKTNFQCNWNNDAIESPFAVQPGLLLTHPVITYSSEFNSYILSYYSTYQVFSSLRGPPAQA